MALFGERMSLALGSSWVASWTGHVLPPNILDAAASCLPWKKCPCPQQAPGQLVKLWLPQFSSWLDNACLQLFIVVLTSARQPVKWPNPAKQISLKSRWVYWPVFCSQSAAGWACPRWGSSGLLLWWRLSAPSPSAAWWHSKAWTEAPQHTPGDRADRKRGVAGSSEDWCVFFRVFQ